MQAVVLIVDDDEPICRMMAAWLRRAGYCCYLAHTVENAAGIAQAVGHELDVLLCDIHLADGRIGKEAIDAVRYFAPALVVIILSGDLDGHTDRPVEYQGEYFLALAKPFSQDQLLSVMTQAINQRDSTGRP